MFDIKWIRDNPDAFDAGLAKRALEPQAAAVIAHDDKRRAHIAALQEAQTRRNAASKEIGKAMGAGDTDKAEALKAEVAEIKAFIQSGEETERTLTAVLNEALSTIPNLPLDDVPQGADESANVEARRVGSVPSFDFAPKEHFELGEALGMMDFEAATRMSGARFVVLTGALARLERALAMFMIDLQTSEHGYTEVNPPFLVRDDALYGTGQLPKFSEDLFQTTGDHWLIPTAEVSLTNLVREQTLDEASLPMRVTAWT
ncbi:MAG: serine--tRNA ligase, partial [Pseudomonadota bacterium]